MEDILEQLGITPNSVRAGIDDLYDSLSSSLGPGLMQTLSGDLTGGISSLMKSTGQLTAQLTKKGITSTYNLTGKLMSSAAKKTWDSVNRVMGVGVDLLKTTLTTGTEEAMKTLQETMSSMKSWWDNQAGDIAKLTGVSNLEIEAAVNEFAESMQAQGYSDKVDPNAFKDMLETATRTMGLEQAKAASEQAAILESAMPGLGEKMLPVFERSLTLAETMGLEGEAAIEYAKQQVDVAASTAFAGQERFGGAALQSLDRVSSAIFDTASSLELTDPGEVVAALSKMDLALSGTNVAMSDVVANIMSADENQLTTLLASSGINAVDRESFIQALNQDSEGTLKAIVDTMTSFTGDNAYQAQAMADVFGVSIDTMRALKTSGDLVSKRYMDLASENVMSTEELMDRVSGQISDSSKIENATATQAMADFKGSVVDLQADTVTMLSGLGDTIGGPLGMVVNGILQLGMVGPDAAKAIVEKIENMLTELPNMVTNIVGGIRAIIPVIMDIVPGLISTLASAIPEVLNSLLSILPVLVDGLGEAILVLGQQLPIILPPILESVLGAVFVTLPGLLGTVLTDILPALLQSVLDLVHQLPDMLRDLAANLPEPWGQLFETVASIVEMLTPILDAIFEAVMELIPVVMDIVTALMPVLVNIIDVVMAIVTPIIEPILMITTALLNFLMPLITNLLDMLLPLISGVLDLVIPIVTRIFEAIMPIMTIVLQIVAPILQVVFNVLEKLWGIVFAIMSPAMEFVGAILEWMSNRWPFKGKSPDREEIDQSEAVVEIKSLDLAGLGIEVPEPSDTVPEPTTNAEPIDLTSLTSELTSTEPTNAETPSLTDSVTSPLLPMTAVAEPTPVNPELLASTTSISDSASDLSDTNANLSDKITDLSTSSADLSTSAASIADSSASIAHSVVMFHPALVALLSYLKNSNSSSKSFSMNPLSTIFSTMNDTLTQVPEDIDVNYTVEDLGYTADILGTSNLELADAIQDIELTLPPDYTEAQLAYQEKVLEKFDLTIKELRELIDLLRESRNVPPRTPHIGSKPSSSVPVGSLATVIGRER